RMTDVFVADESVADVQIKSQSQLYIFGKGSGETTVYASDRSGRTVWSATVRVGSNLESVDQMLDLAMPDAKILVSTIGNNTFLLTGTVASPEDAAEAERLVQAFVSGNAAKANVISRLRTATPLQVNLMVRFAEVSRSLSRQIGTNLATRDLTGGFTMGLARGRVPGTIGAVNTAGLPQLDASAQFGLPAGSVNLPFDPATGKFIVGGTNYTFSPNLAGQTAIGLAGKLFGADILGSLDLGEQVGLVTTLAQPNLTALSGETADFLAGGEYPIPISQGLGTTSVEYKKYGVSLAFTPTVLSNGRISIRVRPEVSQLTSEGAVTLNGFQVPALTIRRAETTVELGSGQSFMIGGLLSNNASSTIDKTPGAGDLPILGALFRSNSFRKNETELVIVVTPYLVNPVDAKDIKLPTDGLQSPDVAQQILGNKFSDGESGTTRPGPTTAPDETPQPGVSVREQAAPSGRAERKSRRGNRSASSKTAAPGFSLN
ncbi:MAG: type II and III secretion system protein family protein, partial [Novosphingobium sp.]